MTDPAWERAAELGGGALLVALGVLALRGGGADHPHRHGGPALVGALFALSGVRALALALPPLLVAERSAWAGAVYVVAFGAGVAAASVAFGLVVAGARRSWPAWTRRAAGVASIALGTWWVVSFG
jgi:hypothetical protein